MGEVNFSQHSHAGCPPGKAVSIAETVPLVVNRETRVFHLTGTVVLLGGFRSPYIIC